ncbi:MAG: phage GP46 family protein [Burkholderiaceae bacterium]|jgi:phage gp46-like protein|nr:phage GP46 family protein [Burkholderiaceae bacterium]
MADIATAWSGFGGDWLLSGADLSADDGLQTAVILSLFTDALADADEAPPGVSRRGWWGDTFADTPGDRIGSKLWLLAREKQLPATLSRAEEQCRAALQWLIDDGVARAVWVSAEWVRMGVLGVSIEVVRNANAVARYRFEVFWKGGSNGV